MLRFICWTVEGRALSKQACQGNNHLHCYRETDKIQSINRTIPRWSQLPWLFFPFLFTLMCHVALFSLPLITFTCPWLSSCVSGPCDFRLSCVFSPCSLVTCVQSVIRPCVFKSPSSWLSLFVCLCISHLSPLVPCVPFSVPSAFFYFFFCISLVPQCAPACFCVFVFFALTFFLCVFLAFCFFGLLCSDSSFVIGAPLLLLSTSHVQSCVLVNETRVIISLHRNELK